METSSFHSFLREHQPDTYGLSVFLVTKKKNAVLYRNTQITLKQLMFLEVIPFCSTQQKHLKQFFRLVSLHKILKICALNRWCLVKLIISSASSKTSLLILSYCKCVVVSVMTVGRAWRHWLDSICGGECSPLVLLYHQWKCKHSENDNALAEFWT